MKEGTTAKQDVNSNVQQMDSSDRQNPVMEIIDNLVLACQVRMAKHLRKNLRSMHPFHQFSCIEMRSYALVPA